ncbi:hypothetical protein [Aquabacterium sp.]|uniref:hypothetical protein n=1 Tax=Aquabacterium sp. TaxID=1872578 RepID=UPI004037877B
MTIPTTAGATPKKPSTEQELDRLFESTGKLARVIEELDSRLTPVLNPVPTNGIGPSATPPTNLSPLAERVRESRYRIEDIETRVHQVLELLDL